MASFTDVGKSLNLRTVPDNQNVFFLSINKLFFKKVPKCKVLTVNKTKNF